MSGRTVLVVIPARGGSKGVPRKNLRRLGGLPLIAHSIRTATTSSHRPTVVVTSDDDEILSVARSMGVAALRRGDDLASDEATLDGVVHHAMQRLGEEMGMAWDIVVTLQPTSPLLRVESLDGAIARLADDPRLDTVISATDDRHLRWVRVDGTLRPEYRSRVNRQFLPETFRETGGFLVTRSDFVTARGRIGPHVDLHPLDGPEGIDIDGVEDFILCEWHLSRRRVLFVVAGHPEIGLGHVQNALALAAELVRHDVRFLVPTGNDLAATVLRSHNYPVLEQQGADLVEEIAALDPHVVVNDFLDTSAAYVTELKRRGFGVVNFEDLGDGARHADLVINAIYPERDTLPGHYFGAEYVLARHEFLVGGVSEFRDEVRRVLVTFGGTDPGDLTRRVLQAITPYCEARSIHVDVILGRGYAHAPPPSVGVVAVQADVGDISDFMRGADVAFTSAGRTVFELAIVGTPGIVLAQNERELTHTFASETHGFTNLGMGMSCAPDAIRDALARLVEQPDQRRRQRDLMLASDVRQGRERVVALVEDAIMRR